MSILPRIDFRWRKQEALLLVAAALTLLVANLSLEFTTDAAITTGMLFGIFLAAHLVLCCFASRADQFILPIAALLNGLGLVMIARLDAASGWSLAQTQIRWTFLGVLLLAVIVVLLKDHRSLQNYSYLFGLIGLVLSALPIVWPAALSNGLNADARVWIAIGPFSIQPGEFAKLLLLLFFAGLLVHKRRMFTTTGRTILGLQFPRLRDLGPLLLVWGVALFIMALQNDFGPALILFGTVIGMLYMATGKSSWLVIALGLATLGAVAVYQISAKIQVRVENFRDPIGNYDELGLQLSQALFGMSWGGLTGTGLGNGYPQNVPVAHSDFILAAFGEELGLIGLSAILMLYALLVSRAFRVAMSTPDAYGKLIAAGMALTLAIQVFVVTGGISRLLPMTGLTTPFLSHGGSSLLANYILLALLLKVSHGAQQREVQGE